MAEAGHRVPEPCRGLAWLLCLSSLAAPGSVCCHCSFCIMCKPLLPSWKQLQDSVLFGDGQVLVPQFPGTARGGRE